MSWQFALFIFYLISTLIVFILFFSQLSSSSTFKLKAVRARYWHARMKETGKIDVIPVRQNALECIRQQSFFNPTDPCFACTLDSISSPNVCKHCSNYISLVSVQSS